MNRWYLCLKKAKSIFSAKKDDVKPTKESKPASKEPAKISKDDTKQDNKKNGDK